MQTKQLHTSVQGHQWWSQHNCRSHCQNKRGISDKLTSKLQNAHYRQHEAILKRGSRRRGLWK